MVLICGGGPSDGRYGEYWGARLWYNHGAFKNNFKGFCSVFVAGGHTKYVGNGNGFYIEPTVFVNVNENMRIFQEEVFGPFVTIMPFAMPAKGISLVNNASYGLGAAIFPSDIERAHRVAARLEAGMVWINSSNDVDFRVAFGGVKQSEIGRELGEDDLAAYTQTKAVHVNMGLNLLPL
ncbi:aldehyde dehydrogenase [Aspergillus ustus]|uniref:Aldehyde dehydrogenase n=1 Tax=Aspergillus ustus TaxID=40382 RepID=A0A0C1BW74_ASPUT|nr:aldehyde dehydrogenase [Aspergillus ustus]